MSRRTLDFDDGFTSETSTNPITIPASEVAVTPSGNVESNQVEQALYEVQGDIDSLNGHVSNTENPHAVTKTQVGLDNVDNTSDAEKNSATATLTNKTLVSPTINTPITDVVTLDGQPSTPSSPTSGNYKMYVKDATQKLTILDSSGVETSVGAGGGLGVNFVQNSDAETGTLNWSTYADAASSRPVDGTGGTSSLTFTNTGTALTGSKSFLISKPASNCQGQGVAGNIVVDLANRGRVVRISFDYLVSSGFTYGTSSTDSDIIVYIYDVDNAKLIEPSSFKILAGSSTRSERFEAEFQTSTSGSGNYRLLFHVATTSTTACDLTIDNVQVSPNAYVFGSPVSSIVEYGAISISAVGAGTAPSKGATTVDRVIGYREGEYWIGEFELRKTSGGASGTTEYLLNLPTGLVANTSKVNTYTGVVSASGIPSAYIGDGMCWTDSGPTFGYAKAVLYSSTQFRCYFTGFYGNQGFWGSGYFGLLQNVNMKVRVRIPILGWSSTVQMADQTSTRVVSFTGTQSSQGVTANTTNIAFTATKDSHGAWNGTQYVVQVPGDYIVNAGVTVSSTGNVAVYKNGSKVQDFATGSGTLAISSGGATLENCVVGDVISLRCGASVTISNGRLGISRISGPSQIAASETIAASYYCSANKSISSTQAADFDSRIYDTHGCVTTGTSWKFTAPISGIYNLVGFWNVSAGINGQWMLYKNGVIYQTLSHANTTVSWANPNIDVPLNANETIEVRSTASATILGGALANPGTGYICIKRVGSRG